MTQPKGISGSQVPPVVKLTWSDDIGKRVREGDWADQAVSTTRKIAEAIDANQWELAAQLIDYWMEEAKVVHVIYQVWTEGFLAHLREQGVPEEEIQAEFTRLRELLAFPDGRPFEASEPWRELGLAAGVLGNSVRGYEIGRASCRERVFRVV